MIDSIKMSEKRSFFSLDRALSVGNRKSEDPDLFFIFNRINQDQFGHRVCSLRTNQPGFFVSIFSSQITGNEVKISYRKSDTRKTRLIRDH
jgi:hypothetical protein